MNTFKKPKSRTNHIYSLTGKSETELTQLINGVEVTLGCDPHNLFNLSILGKLKPYQTDKDGYYDKARPILDPLNWFKSADGQKFITKSDGGSENILFASGYQYIDKPPITIYTRSLYLWLGYLKHCINNIDDAINAELSQ
ncbi:MAG: hypothetical protein K0R14_894 [Burkholderiales bacterium]|jgi:hypothetical protein|nr:hypothetical protein [Burkholderiales bacterium]